jgi:hypothetical protein
MLGCENAVEFYRTSAVEYLLGEGRRILFSSHRVSLVHA